MHRTVNPFPFDVRCTIIRQHAHGKEMRALLTRNAGQLAIFMTNVVLLVNLVIDVVLDQFIKGLSSSIFQQVDFARDI